MRALQRRNLLSATFGTSYCKSHSDLVHFLLYLNRHDFRIGVGSFQLSIYDLTIVHLPTVLLGTKIDEIDDTEEPHTAQREEQADINHL